jgi:hypothetical protein
MGLMQTEKYLLGALRVRRFDWAVPGNTEVPILVLSDPDLEELSQFVGVRHVLQLFVPPATARS